MADESLGLAARPLPVVADVLGEPLRALPDHVQIAFWVDRRPAGRLGGISQVALETSTATGLRSEP